MLTFQDFKYALRLLSKRPGFTILTIMVMAVGLGLSVYLFSFLNTMAFKDLPFEDSETLITIDQSINGREFNGGNLSLHDFYEIRNNVDGLAETTALFETSVNVSGSDGAKRYNAARAEVNVFAITRSKPILGRTYTKSEDQVGSANTVVIGYDMWKNQFGGDPKILERSFRINGAMTQVIGVMPQGYYFPRNAEMWLPLKMEK